MGEKNFPLSERPRALSRDARCWVADCARKEIAAILAKNGTRLAGEALDEKGRLAPAGEAVSAGTPSRPVVLRSGSRRLKRMKKAVA